MESSEADCLKLGGLCHAEWGSWLLDTALQLLSEPERTEEGRYHAYLAQRHPDTSVVSVLKLSQASGSPPDLFIQTGSLGGAR